MSKLKTPVTDQDHTQGDPHAPCTLLEYGDFQCPPCGQADPIVKQLQKHFGKRLRFVFRNFPLAEIHPHAEAAAEAAEFASTHGKFWPMHDLLFAHQHALEPAHLQTYAQQLGLPAAELADALKHHTFEPQVQAHTESGEKSQVHGTPTFFIDGTQVNGSFAFEDLRDAIDQALAPAHT